MSFQSTYWTSTVPTPFGPAPGGGLTGTRRPATVNFQSGFALEALGAEYTVPDQIVKAKGPFFVNNIGVAPGQIPAALLQIVFTDRGAVNQGALDQGLYNAIKASGLRMGSSTRFYPVDVSWAWRKQAAPDKSTKDLYFPVVSGVKGTPSSTYDGLVYSGSAISSAQMLDANFMPTSELLAKLPKQLWVYSFAVTNQNNQFTDADGAKVLTLLKSAWANTLPKLGASAYGYMTLLGADPSVFEAPAPTPVPEPIAKKSNTWLWLLGGAVVAGYVHTPKAGTRSQAYAKKLLGRRR